MNVAWDNVYEDFAVIRDWYRTLRDAYRKTDDGNYGLTGLEKEELEELEAFLGMPMVVMSSMEAEGEMGASDLKAMLNSGQMTKEQVLQAEKRKWET